MNAYKRIDRKMATAMLAMVVAVMTGTGCVPEATALADFEICSVFSGGDLDTDWDTNWGTGYDYTDYEYGGHDGYDYVAQDLGYQDFDSWAGDSISTFTGSFVSYD